MIEVRGWRRILLVLLPFAAGYYLSYLFRTINALISAQLGADLALGAAELGLLTSAYFLAFASIQLPVGIMLDRYGPRRVQSVLLLVAAAGAAIFAAAHDLLMLIVGRALIGFGVAAALISGLKAIVLWFPKERVALVNGCFIMLGSLGALTATVPADMLLPRIGWRGLFEFLAAVTAGCAMAIYILVPEPAAAASMKNSASIGLKKIYADRRFWRLAPLSTMCISTAWALQGLWAGPWLTDVESLERPEVVRHLFVMALALSAGALLMGTGADRLRRRGVHPRKLFGVVAAAFIAAQLALIFYLSSSYFLWAVVACVGGATVLSYAILADYFPREVAGQANAALIIFHIGGAFVVQYSIGLVVDRWTNHAGHYPSIAYKIALAGVVTLQFLALLWFLRPERRVEQSGTGLHQGPLQVREQCAGELTAKA
jgi:MFS family permease